MDDDDHQQTNFKHFCRICRKGFMCGRALGGHMRAHGIGEEAGGNNIDDDEEEQASDWEEKSDRKSQKRMYSLRTNPNRLKSCRACEHCGKEFLSWKSFLEHGKCSFSAEEEEESLVSTPSPESEDEEDDVRAEIGWSKRKRSLRSEDEDLELAKCLMQLANARFDPMMMTAEPPEESSCASVAAAGRVQAAEKAKGVIVVANKGLFECKACKKVFNSHQALGGHRASHKKVKGCYASKVVDDNNNNNNNNNLDEDVDVFAHEEFFPTKSTNSYLAYDNVSRKKSKVHECSICHRIFSTGQALGGHKRCHWITSNSQETSATIPKFHFQDHHQIMQRPPPPTPPHFVNQSESLDLNLPAPSDEIAGIRTEHPRHRPLRYEISTEIHLHPWISEENNIIEEDDVVKSNNNSGSNSCNDNTIEDDDNVNKINTNNNNNNNNSSSMNNNNNNNNNNNEGESDELKMGKLSGLKDMDVNGGYSEWLTVGIGSRTDVGAHP